MYYCEKFNETKGNLKQYWMLLKEIINKHKAKSNCQISYR